jgi:non-haem Fe2+, alpha-ketoglutarate-dependent halogenase
MRSAQGRGNKLLTPEEVRRFEEEGIIFPVPLVPPGEVNRFQEGFRDLEVRGGGVQKYTVLPHMFFPWAWELASLPRLLDAVEDLIGPELVIDSSLLLCKYARDPAFAPWHQDGIYSEWYKTPSVSAWIAIVDATPENGCMQVIPGSHLKGRVAHTNVVRQDSLFGPSPEIEVEVDETQAVCVALDAGEASFHHSSIVHGSPPNRSDRKRISLIVRFVTPLFRERQATVPAVRVRGSADLSHMLQEQMPPRGEPDECFARWQAFAERHQPRRNISATASS